MDWELADVVALAVASAHDEGSDDAPPTTADIAVALGFDDGAMSNSVQLLSVVRTLLDRGLIVERVDEEADRRGYAPTPAGGDHAATFERELADATVTVDDGETARTVPASDVGAVVDGLTRTACLARLVHGSVLYRSRTREGLVGRDRSLDALRDAVADDDDRTVLVRGAAGVGKTALVEALVDAVAGEATALVGECDPTVTEPYGPVTDALADSPVPVDGEPTLSDGGGFVDARPTEDPDVVAARATRFRERLVDALEARAGTEPLVLVVEDLQWADAETLALLDHLAGADLSVTVVGTYRPGAVGESHPVRSVREGVDETIDLASLDREETAALVARTVGSEAVPGPFVDRVYERTDGNPLFVREALAQLPTGSVLDGAPDRETVELPDAIETAVRGSLDALDDDGRDVLERVALAGRSIPTAVLADVAAAPAAVVEEYVSLFADGRYLERSDDVVTFVDERARRVLVSALDDERRRRIHDALARAFEAVVSTESTVSRDRIAYHYERADRPRQACEAYVAAGRQAEAVYAHETAIERYDAAMRTAREAGDEGTLLDAVERKGAVHLGRGEYDDAEQAFEYVRERATDPERRRMAAYHYSRVVAEREGYDAALSVVETALGDDPETTPAAARLLGQRGWVRMNRGEYEAAEQAFERLSAMADALDDDRLRAQAHDHLGVTYFRWDRTERAHEHCERAVELVEPLDDAFVLGRYLNHLSMTIADRERSATVYQRALAANREAGDVVTECDTLTNLGFLASKEDPAAALSYFRESAERAERLGYAKGVGAGNFNAGTVQIPLGELTAARERLETSRDVHDRIGRVLFLHGDYDGLATIDLLLDDLSSAQEYAERGLAVAEDVGRAIDRVDSLLTLGDVVRAREGSDAGRHHHRRALELAREDGDVRSLLLAHLALAGDDLAAGDDRAALRHADAAAAYAEAESDRRRVASAAYRRGVALRRVGEGGRAALDRAIAVADERDLRLVETAARFERARLLDGVRSPGVDPADDRERARALVAATSAVRLRLVADRPDAAVPTSV